MNHNRSVSNSRVSLRSSKGASFCQIIFRMCLLCAEKSDKGVWGSVFPTRIFRPAKLLSPPVIRKLVCRTLDAVDCIELVGSERREYEQQTEATTQLGTVAGLWTSQYKLVKRWSPLIPSRCLHHPTVPLKHFLSHLFLLVVGKFSTEGWVSGEGWLGR